VDRETLLTLSKDDLVALILAPAAQIGATRLPPGVNRLKT